MDGHKRCRVGTVAAIGLVMAAGAPAAAASDAVLARGSVPDTAPGTPVKAYVTPAHTSKRRTAMKLAGTGVTDAQGHFVLRSSDAAEVTSAADANKATDLIVLARTRNGGWAEQYAQVERSRLASASAASVRKAPVVRMKPLGTSATASSRPSCQDSGDVGAPKVKRVDTFKRQVVVGELNNAYRDTRASWRYGRSADSQISTGIKASGKGWDLSASKHIQNNAETSISLTRHAYARRIRSGFFFVQNRYYLCPAPGAGSSYDRVGPTSWETGVLTRNQGGTTGVCTNGPDFVQGSGFRRDRRRATTWTRAANLLGLDLLARSGFSESVVTAYKFGDEVGRHRLCGERGRSPADSGRIFSGEGKPRT